VSVKVAVDELAERIDEHDFCYAITVSAAATAHLVAVVPHWDGGRGVLVIDVGRSSRENVADRPAITLCFPPRTRDGMTLIVDGTAVVEGESLHVAPSTAILHRPAPGVPS
jgi:hypothetical protein